MLSFRLLSRTRLITATGLVAVASVLGGACGGDTLGVATTVVNVTPTNFATIPPVNSTLPGTTTTLPVNAVGAESKYVVKAGDSPLAVANKYNISLTTLLAYNGWVSPAQFPYPGTEILIPAQAVVQPTQSSTPSGSTPANPSGPTITGPNCGTRPAGTYVIKSGDSIFSIKEDFCVSTGALLSANGWSDVGSVVLLPGKTIQIPQAGY